MRICNPRVAAYLVAIVVAGALSYDLMRVPVQVSDSLGEILDAQQSPSVYASFTGSFGGAGLLVWVVVVSAWAVGMPGISRRGALAVTALLGVYFTVRFFVFHVSTPGLDERSSGFLLATLDPDELELRFGGHPIWFYAYNVAASTMSVLFSEPQSGVFVSVRAWLQGDVPPRLYAATVWAFRSAGVHHLMRVQAFQQRSDWAFRMDTIRDAGLPDDPQATALIGQLRRDALEMRLPNRYTLPRWADRWWGE